MSASRVPDYLDHMLEAAVQACAYVEGLPKQDFLADKRTQQAVILNLILSVKRPPSCSRMTRLSQTCIRRCRGAA